jgi:hypothetical protein
MSRELLLGLQLAASGRIVDFSEGNSHHHQLFAAEMSSWEELKDWFHPLYEDLVARLRAACQSPCPPTCGLADLLASRGHEAVCRELGLRRRPLFPRLSFPRLAPSLIQGLLC